MTVSKHDFTRVRCTLDVPAADGRGRSGARPSSDAIDRCVARAQPGTAVAVADTVSYGYNAHNEVTSATAANNPVYAFTYQYDPSRLRAEATACRVGSRQTYTYDPNGYLVVLVDAQTGATSTTYEYDPFGNTVLTTGAHAAQNPFRFSTKHTDAETKRLYYGYRYLDTETGRWVSRDPMGEYGGINPYSALRNQPGSRYDRYGLVDVDVRAPRELWNQSGFGSLGLYENNATVNCSCDSSCCVKCRISARPTIKFVISMADENQEKDVIYGGVSASGIPVNLTAHERYHHQVFLNVYVPNLVSFLERYEKSYDGSLRCAVSRLLAEGMFATELAALNKWEYEQEYGTPTHRLPVVDYGSTFEPIIP